MLDERPDSRALVSAGFRVRPADTGGGEVRALADVLVDCVAGGASVGFMEPLDYEHAEAFWRPTLESAALEAGNPLLVLDTASADAEPLYERLGWQRVGVIPDYALWPAGGYVDTVVFYKQLAGGS